MSGQGGERCTCGAAAGQERHNDLSPQCRRGSHKACVGLYSSTSSHWWCACDCHPEPNVAAVSHSANLGAVKRALATYRAARARRTTPPGANR